MKTNFIWLILFIIFIPINIKAFTNKNFSTIISFQTQKFDNQGSTEDKYPNINPSITSEEDFKCETIFLNPDGTEKELKKILENLYTILRIVAVVIALALSGADFIKSLGKGDDDILKKVFFRTIKRLIIAILFMFLPNFLELIFEMFGLYDLSNCGIG